MPSITLLDSAVLSQDQLVVGVIENLITVNQMYQVLPFLPIEGNSLAYNREDVLGDVQVAGINTVVTAKNPATFTPVNSNLTTIIGDAEVNGLVQATRSNKQDQTAAQVASKAKSCGRSFQNMLINGTGAGNEFDGLLNLAQRQATTGGSGSNLSFTILDELLDLVTDKDGQVDYIAMNQRTLRSYNVLLRALGGASVNEVVELPSGQRVQAYRGVPMFKNDWIPIDQVKGGGTACTTIFAGTFDDGSQMHGLSGLTAANAAGIMIEDVGVAEAADNRITRVKWYAGLALFSENGLSFADGILN
jgi:hypothetical protein